MSQRSNNINKLPTLLDNDPQKHRDLLAALQQLLPLSRLWDVATGYFEIGALLKLDEFWPQLEKIRLIMGDETTRRTREVILSSIQQRVDNGIELSKETDDTMAGILRIKAALQTKQIQIRIFTERKFHAKAQHLTAKDGPVNFGIIGSSNFTLPGLTENIELNLFTTAYEQLEALHGWFEEVWKRSEAVAPDIIKIIERHLQPFAPFAIWAKALYEYFADLEIPLTDWEEQQSAIFPVLSKYQQDGYRQARAIAEKWGGALLCDGVGLGKTFVGLMLLEYHLQRGHKVLLIVPKSARSSVWEQNIQRYLEPFANYRVLLEEHLRIYNHTDLGRPDTISQPKLDYYRDIYDVIMVDEAHHFRTPAATRSKMLRHLSGGKAKQLYFLTATPINNSLRDLAHLIQYITQDRQDYFAPLGIQNLRNHFTQAEKDLENQLAQSGTDLETEGNSGLLHTDHLLRTLVIQRSRAYVKESEQGSGKVPIFPKREPPQVIAYSLQQVYSGLYDQLRAAFHKDDPLLSLAVYNSQSFKRNGQDNELLNRDRQILGLIRTLFLKRLESSYQAFEISLEELLLRMAAFLKKYGPARWHTWQEGHREVVARVSKNQQERQPGLNDYGDEEEDNELADIAQSPELPGPVAEYDLEKLLTAVEEDMGLMAKLLDNLLRRLSPQKDDKLQQLMACLRQDRRLQSGKVVIFTEFKDTARYLWRQLQEAGFAQVEELDSSRQIARETVIKRFAPYYNCRQDELARFFQDHEPISILISTDVLSEGLNLQDASLIINYDLHWNPVRLMQRIGRVDRRLAPDIEKSLGRSDVRIQIYNFLPPDELEELLGLFKRVTGKLVRISKTLGIESPVLTPDDDFEALRLFNEKYEGTKSIEEELHLELEKLRQDHPRLYSELAQFPKRVFSAKTTAGKASGLFCAYRFPAKLGSCQDSRGELRWYFRLAETGEIWESQRLADIAAAIRSLPDTARSVPASPQQLQQWRQEIERQCVQRQMRNVQAPLGAKAELVCWMQVG